MFYPAGGSLVSCRQHERQFRILHISAVADLCNMQKYDHISHFIVARNNIYGIIQILKRAVTGFLPLKRRCVYVSVPLQFQLLCNLFLLVGRAKTLRSVGQQIRGQQSDGNRYMPESEVRRMETDETGNRRLFGVPQMGALK